MQEFLVSKENAYKNKTEQNMNGMAEDESRHESRGRLGWYERMHLPLINTGAKRQINNWGYKYVSRLNI